MSRASVAKEINITFLDVHFKQKWRLRLLIEGFCCWMKTSANEEVFHLFTENKFLLPLPVSIQGWFWSLFALIIYYRIQCHFLKSSNLIWSKTLKVHAVYTAHKMKKSLTENFIFCTRSDECNILNALICKYLK